MESQLNSVCNGVRGRISAASASIVVVVPPDATFVGANHCGCAMETVHVKFWNILCLPVLVESCINFHACCARQRTYTLLPRSKVDASDDTGTFCAGEAVCKLRKKFVVIADAAPESCCFACFNGNFDDFAGNVLITISFHGRIYTLP